MSTPNDPQDDTLATEVFDREPVAASGPSAPAASGPSVHTAAPPARPYLPGPALFALVLGLLGLFVAGAVLVGELTDATVQWDRLGPWTVVTAGVVVLLLGALGLRASRSRD